MNASHLAPSGSVRFPGAVAWLSRYWLIAGAVLLFAGPGLLDLMRREWSSEQGASGPIILASGLWLLARESRTLWPVTAPRPAVPLLLALLMPLLLAYVFATIVNMLWLEWLCVYLALVIVLFAYVGGAVMRRLWFPLVYLLFLIPPPYVLIAPITNSRKLWLSITSIDILSALGFEAAYNGTTLYIDQYELRIADACAGMNSLISLLAIGLFYVYVLHRADWRYATLLALLALPIAMFANLARILLLLLAAHYLGVEAAEGALHETAGLFMFLVALGCLILTDAILSPLRRALGRR